MTDWNKDHDPFDFSSALDGLSNADDLGNAKQDSSNLSFGSGSSTGFGASGFGGTSEFGSSGFDTSSSFGSSGFDTSSLGSSGFDTSSSFGSSGIDTSSLGSSGIDTSSLGASLGGSSTSNIDSSISAEANFSPSTDASDFPQANESDVSALRAKLFEDFLAQSGASPETINALSERVKSNQIPIGSVLAPGEDSFDVQNTPGTSDYSSSNYSSSGSTSDRWKNANLVNQYVQNRGGRQTKQFTSVEDIYQAASQQITNNPQVQTVQKAGKGCIIAFAIIFFAPFILAILGIVIAAIITAFDSPSEDSQKPPTVSSTSPSFSFGNDNYADSEVVRHIEKPARPNSDMPNPVFEFLDNADTEVFYTCLKTPENEYRKIRASIDIEFFITKGRRARDISATTDDFTLSRNKIEECAEEFFSLLPDFPESADIYRKYTWKLNLYMN